MWQKISCWWQFAQILEIISSPIPFIWINIYGYILKWCSQNITMEAHFKGKLLLQETCVVKANNNRRVKAFVNKTTKTTYLTFHSQTGYFTCVQFTLLIMHECHFNCDESKCHHSTNYIAPNYYCLGKQKYSTLFSTFFSVGRIVRTSTHERILLLFILYESS